jgi:hypothetical protein
VVDCPFCGAPQTDRFTVEGQTFLVFRCLFTPQVDPALDDAALAEHFRQTYGENGSAYFRGMCDRLHLYVTKGDGAKELTGSADGETPSSS